MQLTKTIQLAIISALASFLTACATNETAEPSGAEWTSTTIEKQPASAPSATASSSQAADQNEIVIPLHEERLKVGKRSVETGQIRVRKIVTTETVSQPIELRKESIVIERMPAGAEPTARTSTAPSGDAQSFQEEDVTITIHEEQPVVEKEVVVGDSFVARKIPGTERVNVQREIRREEIKLDQSGDTAAVEIKGFGEAAGAERPQKQQMKDQQETSPRQQQE